MYRIAIQTCATLVLMLVTVASAHAAAPNIVIILADDQGWGDLSVTGNTNIATPHIDMIARDGATINRFYAQPVCAPTRAEMLTGRYHPRTGVRGVSRGEERMNPDETTLAEVLKTAGYATGIFGKWHNGTQHPYHPNSQGFDEFYGFASGHWGNYFDPLLEHNGEAVRGKGYISDDLTTHALDFIENNRETPFLCHLAFCTPHTPFQVPDKFYDKFANAEFEMKHRDPEKEVLDATRSALAMCENIDWNVGRVLKKLDALGLDDNTIVLYFSDNGPNSWRWNGGMKGRKGEVSEGGVRVPCFIKWPGHIKPGTKVTPIAGAIDLLPTFAELAGVPLETAHPIDGVSIAPLLLGKDVAWADRNLYSMRAMFTSVRNQRFHFDSRGDLYDLDKDPGQNTPVNDQFPEMAKDLEAALKTWQKDVQPDPLRDTRPFMIGYGDFPNTVLPARDGEPHGNVERSAGAPNCSYFTHWSATDDSMTWNVEVAEAADYDVSVYYTCPEADIGATIKLALGDASLTATVTDPHDPPAYGMENDRVPRGSESYVKDFKPMSLGTIHLEPGTGTLTLTATGIPGNTVMEVRGLVFTKK